MDQKQKPGEDYWAIPQTLLIRMGYGSGANAKLPSQRHDVLRKAMGADFSKFLEPQEYEDFKAVKWGAPNSVDRLEAVETCLSFPLHNWTTGFRSGMEEAVRQRLEDLCFLKQEYSRLDPNRSWEYDRLKDRQA